jgi:HK97 family phage portal protein
MGILRKMGIRSLSLTDEKAWNTSLWNLFGSQSLSGENVNEYTALNYSTFWNGVNTYANDTSTLPLHLQRKDKRNTILASEKPLFRVMHDQANPFMTAQTLRAALMAHVLTWGNGYAEIVRDSLGVVRELWPITPNRVKPKWEDGGIAYEIIVGTDIVTLGPDKILHLHLLTFGGLVGYSLVALARKGIGLGMAMESFGAEYFGNGTHPGMIVEHPKTLTAQGSQNLRDSLHATYSGLGQAHRLMILEEGMQAKPIAIPPEDSQFLESRQFQITEMAQWFNLPPHKLKDLQRSSFNNISSEERSYFTGSLLPVLVTLEQQYNMQLLTLDEKIRQNLYFRHNASGILRGDDDGRINLYRGLFQVGAMSPNDIREKEDMDPIDEEFADEYFVPMNMIPLSMVREMLEKGSKPAASNQPAPDGQTGGQNNEKVV